MQSGPLYLVDPSGNPNSGDKFSASAWLRYLAKMRTDAVGRLYSRQPSRMQLHFDALHPRLRVTNTLWCLVLGSADLPPVPAERPLFQNFVRVAPGDEAYGDSQLWASILPWQAAPRHRPSGSTPLPNAPFGAARRTRTPH